ncbi:hypothetical protein CC85DRAFT_300990 [Cutaneotrichosporon oleaginosum]|uniref:Uncharacterized protein n=1 Tax=Cutaneotrichosporon oleaginosum TaxID=879819 RepID=A0A0J0XRU9_9TREE|nr:uncharacterized protein CC85DRAFT_300990 [Cutaneotrichosporon oleaginosum]KLT43817.1 hypothetical protein CC85DRAFT_300990 [Cutaneotrichosporon oleaginosum]TXT06441.1 hypothetical protein COLE_05772 [Cutaneotrichosporon oleaginosum]
MATRGVSQAQITKRARLERPPVNPLSPVQAIYLQLIKQWYGQFIQQLPPGTGHKVQGAHFYSWDEATGPMAPTWQPKHFKPLLAIAANRQGESGQAIAERTFYISVFYVLQLYDRARLVAGCPPLTSDAKVSVWDIARASLGAAQAPKGR